MRRINAVGSQIIVSVLDLETRTEYAPDGTAFRYAVDPETGLAMAADQIHPPLGTVISCGPDAPHDLRPGTQIVLQRDLGGQWAWEGMTLQALATAERCPRCERPVPSDAVAAEAIVEDGRRVYLARGMRVLVRPDSPPERSPLELDVHRKHDALRWGTIMGVGEDCNAGVTLVDLDQRVAWVHGTAGSFGWSDGGRAYVSLPTGRWCEACGAVVRESALVAEEEGDDEGDL